MTLVILAAGMGSRYGGMKQIDPINDDGNFIIDFSIYDAIQVGFNKVIFIIKEENLNNFKNTIGNRIGKYIDVEYAYQSIANVPAWFEIPAERSKPWGTTQALLSVNGIVNEPFAVINSDDFYGREAFEILYKHLSNTSDITDKPSFCMAGYKLRNTVTEHGAVNRGICKVDEFGHLQSIQEARGIITTREGIAKYNDGKGEVELDLDTVVSMNCWGFTPAIFEHLLADFDKFLMEINNPLKDESYLTDVVESMIKSNSCEIKVYNTDACWLGVTYAEDKPTVVAGIKQLIGKGVYPEHLWN